MSIVVEVLLKKVSDDCSVALEPGTEVTMSPVKLPLLSVFQSVY